MLNLYFLKANKPAVGVRVIAADLDDALFIARKTGRIRQKYYVAAQCPIHPGDPRQESGYLLGSPGSQTFVPMNVRLEKLRTLLHVLDD